jgi:hypothetical protein
MDRTSVPAPRRGRRLRASLRWTGGLLAALVLAWFLLRAWPLGAERDDALRAMSAPTPPVAGRDGSDFVWLVDHDVPPPRRAELARAYRAYLDRRDALLAAGREVDAKALADPLAPYTTIEDGNDSKALCAGEERCLGKVRADPDAAASVLAAHALAHARALALADFDGLRYGVRPSLTRVFPHYSAGRKLALTGFALQHVRGDAEGALVATCRDVAGWRRLGADSDLLITNQIGAAYVMQDLQLLAEMLAAEPTRTGLPPACTEALAPTRAAELDLCPAMRGEFRSMESMFAMSWDQDDGVWSDLMRASVDRKRTLARIAPQYARYCSTAMHDAVRADRPTGTVPETGDCAAYEMAGDPVGCILVQIARGNEFDDHQEWRGDMAAALALMRTVLWLRAQSPDPATWPDRLPGRPDELGLRRTASVTADGRTLHMARRRQGKGDIDWPLVPEAVVPPPPADESAQ